MFALIFGNLEVFGDYRNPIACHNMYVCIIYVFTFFLRLIGPPIIVIPF